jgi:hypothetical protein
MARHTEACSTGDVRGEIDTPRIVRIVETAVLRVDNAHRDA